MNSPYMGRFTVTQAYSSAHDGLDLVGLDSKQIHSTVNGTVIHAGWENPSNHSQGFGLYVCIRVGNQDYYYGHMSQIYVSVGQTVKITDIIGLEGSTGYSTGSHCHYCCRVAGTRTPLDINAISGIPNVVGGVYDDGGSGGTIPGGGGISGGTPNGGTLTDAFQLSYLNGGSWNNFTNQVMSSMDGIRIQTTKSRSYYLQYRTWNQGQSGFYPYVKSTDNDYAGSSGKPIQLLQIQAFDNNGTKLTTGVVVMYRVHVGGRWLSWVSNADPEWMQAVFTAHNLDGSLDTSSADAGLQGQNIDGVEIRVYESNSSEGPGDLTGGEVSANITYLENGNWSDMGTGVLVDHMDGLKIQTDTSKSYYLSYQTWNQGQSGFYPAVTSWENDYAGSNGKPIQLVSIKAFQRDGTKLTSGVIVMYRAFVGGRWLPWVSNADPQWMQSVKNKFGLDGTLDTTGYYAGLDGQNISGLEIHIFEDDSFNPGTGDFSGSEISLATSYMFDNLSNWNTFDKTVTADHIDGVKIQTDSTHGFYLTYQTWNQGQGGFYPEVTSLQNDYAGSAGKPIQLLSIRAYKSDGTKLTSGVVIMYRALVNGRWLPWVSNADPQWMDSVKSQYNLDGTLDYTSYYAGIDGQNISGLEIRAFVGTTNDTPIEGLTGQEAPPVLSYMVDNNWTNFDKSVIPGRLDGLKIQTDASKPYYITYRTHNQGQGTYYPFVTSRENDYAGSAGKPIQLLSLYAYRNDGTKLVTGVVVMYRAYVEGRWLPWVSNANPEWMRSVQAKYSLDGTLDTSSYYAGIEGKNISGIEVRIFEENNANIPDTPQTPTGNYKIIDAPFISQNPNYPTGCESVSTVMALQYAGVEISVDKFIDNYLYKTGIPFDPNISFGGDPRSVYSYGCYAPVIKNALDKCFSTEGLSTYSATQLSNVSLQQLCAEYIDNNIPVILWATMNMASPYNGNRWTYNGKTIQWIAPEHCLLLVGYDDEHYIFNDPLRSKQTYYRKSAVETAYAGLFKQAVVIKKYKYVRPPIPAVKPGTRLMSDLINDIYKLETYYKQYCEAYFLYPGTQPTGIDVAKGITNFLRSEVYNDWEWYFTLGTGVDQGYISYLKNLDGISQSLYEKTMQYIRGKNALELHDGEGGIIDLPHLAATTEAYLSNGLAPKYWASWGGDLATGMADTTKRLATNSDPSSEYYGKSLQEIADMTIGNENSSCNYTDFCCDFDSYKIGTLILEACQPGSQDEYNVHLLSDVLKRYYVEQQLFRNRFKWLEEELDVHPLHLILEVETAMGGSFDGKLLVDIKGEGPTPEVNKACCESFCAYVLTMRPS